MSQKSPSAIVEISKVTSLFEFDGVYELGFSASMLDTYSQAELISSMSKIVKDVQPDWVFCPYRNDAHSDHQIAFDATLAVTKSFRYPFIKRVMCYETISETNFALKPEDPGFKPQVFIDISGVLKKKLDILKIYSSELGDFPFPRSLKAVEALAILRGSQANQEASEAFMLLKEIFMTIIIAEAGVNHNGDENLAYALVDAQKAGADIVKFQTFKAEKLASKFADKADYQIEKTGGAESQLSMLQKLELSYDAFIRLSDYCKQKDITFMSTAFEEESLNFLVEKLDVKTLKYRRAKLPMLLYF